MYEYIHTNIIIIIWSWNELCISLVHITPSHHSTTVANQIYQTNYRTRRKVCCYCSNKKSEHDTAWGDEVLQDAEGGMGHTICQSVVSVCPSLTCRHNNISWCIHLNKGKRCWRHDVSEIYIFQSKISKKIGEYQAYIMRNNMLPYGSQPV